MNSRLNMVVRVCETDADTYHRDSSLLLITLYVYVDARQKKKQ